MKAALIVDMPYSCSDCKLVSYLYECNFMTRNRGVKLNLISRHESCPLIPITDEQAMELKEGKCETQTPNII